MESVKEPQQRKAAAPPAEPPKSAPPRQTCKYCYKECPDVQERYGFFLSKLLITPPYLLCNKCYLHGLGIIESLNTPPPYGSVKVDFAARRISGSTYVESLNRYVEFSTDLRLFAVWLAIDVDITSIKKFMALADGVRTDFSSSGYDWHAEMWCGFGDTSSGYDWRDIRDSSDLAKAQMFVLAKGILKEHRSPLSHIGLPADLIEALTS